MCLVSYYTALHVIYTHILSGAIYNMWFTMIVSDASCNRADNCVMYNGVMYNGDVQCVTMVCDVQWCDVQWCDVQWCDVQWCDVQWCDVQWCDVQWCDVQWCDVQHSTHNNDIVRSVFQMITSVASSNTLRNKTASQSMRRLTGRELFISVEEVGERTYAVHFVQFDSAMITFLPRCRLRREC